MTEHLYAGFVAYNEATDETVLRMMNDDGGAPLDRSSAAAKTSVVCLNLAVWEIRSTQTTAELGS